MGAGVPVAMLVEGVSEGLALRHVCAWCGLVTAKGDPGAETSHGICPACERRERSPRTAALIEDLEDEALRLPWGSLRRRRLEALRHQFRVLVDRGGELTPEAEACLRRRLP